MTRVNQEKVEHTIAHQHDDARKNAPTLLDVMDAPATKSGTAPAGEATFKAHLDPDKVARTVGHQHHDASKKAPTLLDVMDPPTNKPEEGQHHPANHPVAPDDAYDVTHQHHNPNHPMYAKQANGTYPDAAYQM